MSCKYIAAIIRTLTSIGEWVGLTYSLQTCERTVSWSALIQPFLLYCHFELQIDEVSGHSRELVERLKKTA